jgi:hypothetical protein
METKISARSRKEGCNIPTKHLAAFLGEMLRKIFKEGCKISTTHLAAFLPCSLGEGGIQINGR